MELPKIDISLNMATRVVSKSFIVMTRDELLISRNKMDKKSLSKIRHLMRKMMEVQNGSLLVDKNFVGKRHFSNLLFPRYLLMVLGS